MLSLDDMLVRFAREAGIAVPPDLDAYDEESFPHWKVYTVMQLGRPVGGESHLLNAQAIAAIPNDRIRQVPTSELELRMG